MLGTEKMASFVYHSLMPSLVAKAFLCLELIKIKSNQIKSNPGSTTQEGKTTCGPPCHLQNCLQAQNTVMPSALACYYTTAHSTNRGCHQGSVSHVASLQHELPQCASMWFLNRKEKSRSLSIMKRNGTGY